jgi:ribosomal protein S12 methylthiotransferase
VTTNSLSRPFLIPLKGSGCSAVKFYLHKLGCPKNDVDGDYISACLIDAGHEQVNNPEQAESIIVNTCGFILPAKEESIDEILRLGQLKKNGRLKRLYASGCLSQRYGDELLADMPELDGAFGLGALDSLAKAVTSFSNNCKSIKTPPHKLDYLSWHHRFISDDYPYAYLKISDGCDRGCTYCAIPGIRGRFRSRPIDSILSEAEFLADRGKKELVLVSQDATLYGYDLKGCPTILDLLSELERIERVKWIRLLYLYPPELEEEIIEYLAADNKTLNYFDLPLQHVNSEILSAMGRQINGSRVRRLVKAIRRISPDAVLRTNFIVGFPGETEQQFEELKNFIAEYQFDRMGVFTYSQEEGTLAERLSGQIAEEVKSSRMDELMNLQREIALTKNEDLIGSLQEVIIDSVEDEQTAVGRTRGDCPEIDQEVYVRGNGLCRGDIVKVHIDAADGYDLRGTFVEA